MLPEDPRHGTPAGYRNGCRNTCCRRAIATYNERRRLHVLTGTWDRAHQPATGTRRRLQALMTLGWSAPQIARHLDTDPAWIRFLIHQSDRVARGTHDKIAAAYDDPSMRLPPQGTRGERQGATRARRYAATRGWLPPLAWDDIDHDPTPPAHLELVDDQVDDVVVRRILHGDPTPARAATRAERCAVVAAWPTTGRPLADLARLTGWKPERYTTQTPAAATSTPAAAGHTTSTTNQAGATAA